MTDDSRLLHDDVPFSTVIDMLVNAPGARARRASWPSGWCLVAVPGSEITVSADRPLGAALPYLVGEIVAYAPHIDLYRPDTGQLSAWVPGQSDLFAHDWTVNR
ncbi:MAG: hypothetical protein HOY78_02480 [Saccharothrix sp.]|nr:hypothetical protein [Saccharothrix sp.]